MVLELDAKHDRSDGGVDVHSAGLREHDAASGKLDGTLEPVFERRLGDPAGPQDDAHSPSEAHSLRLVDLRRKFDRAAACCRKAQGQKETFWPCRRSGDAHGVQAAEIEHAVNDGDLGDLCLVGMEAQA